MTRWFIDDLKGGITDDKIHEGGLGEDIFSADEDGADVLFPDVRDYGGLGVADNFRCLIRRDGIGKVFEALLNVIPEVLSIVLRNRDIALGNRNRGLFAPA